VTGTHGIAEVLDFWFEGVDGSGPAPKAAFARWFGKSEDTDREIAARFGKRVDQALRGELDRWIETPRGRLALVILLDQFTRNLFRGTARAFSGDVRALALCREGIARGDDDALDHHQRVFLYLPLEHAEDAGAQADSVRVFEALAAAVPSTLRGEFEGYLDYARRHAEVIERFGRFPHRNRALGRPSSEQELAFLSQPGSSF
jgi:uncharacterized protein (DUF924 family)